MDPNRLLQDADIKDTAAKQKQAECERISASLKMEQSTADKLTMRHQENIRVIESDMVSHPDQADQLKADLDRMNSEYEANMFSVQQKITSHEKQATAAAEEAKRLHEQAEQDRESANRRNAAIAATMAATQDNQAA